MKVATVCVFNKERPLDGIIAHLARNCSSSDCDNVCSGTLVKVTSSEAWRGSPRNVVDFSSNSVFCSVWEPNSWICYKLREECVGGVTPTSYSIRSVGYGPGWYHPKSWVLEVSYNGKEGSWVVVDSRENNEDLNNMHVIRNFAISDSPSEVRFVRLRQTGKNHFGNDCLALCALELFGTVTNPRTPAPGEFVFDQLNPQNGIIAHLTRECGGNVHEKGIVKVTASSCFPGGEPEKVVELGQCDAVFLSDDLPNSWFCYDFKGKRVTPTSYSIWPFDGGCFPRSWVLEVSNDGNEGSWVVVDCRKDNYRLRQFMSSNFKIRPIPSDGFRFFRLRQAGKNDNGGDQLVIKRLELFGVLSHE